MMLQSQAAKLIFFWRPIDGKLPANGIPWIHTWKFQSMDEEYSVDQLYI